MHIETWMVHTHGCPRRYEHRVDVVFAGHVHAYERTYPVYGGQRATSNSGHKIDINIGDGGNREGAVTFMQLSQRSNNCSSCHA